jgi:hypothetical protein
MQHGVIARVGKDRQRAPACFGTWKNGPQIRGEEARTALGFMDGGDSELPKALEQCRVRTRHVLYNNSVGHKKKFVF